jgi:hypothetical protein
MYRCVPVLSRPLVGLTALAVALLTLGAARAQTLSDGLTPLQNKYDALRRRGDIKNLMLGTDRFDPDKHKEAVAVLAKYPIYQLYLRHFDREPGKIAGLYSDFEKNLKELQRYHGKNMTEGIIPAFSHESMLAALEVLRKPEASWVVRANAARVLARLADLGQGELAGALVDVLKDSRQTDAVRYYVLQGLRNLLARQPPPGSDTPPVVSTEQQDKIAGAVLELLNRPPSWLHANSPAEEVDGYRLLRREALRVMALLHAPALGEKDRPALALVRFAGNDGRVAPRPRLDERLEAAVGLAGMRPGKEYQPDYAAYQIGRFVVEFGSAANDELGKSTPAAQRKRPWKIDAARLLEALDVMKAQSKNEYVNKAAAQMAAVLSKIELGQQARPQDLTDWLAGNPPASKELFKDLPDSAVKPAAEAEEEKE